jgi:hypothetical protein
MDGDGLLPSLREEEIIERKFWSRYSSSGMSRDRSERMEENQQEKKRNQENFSRFS